MPAPISLCLPPNIQQPWLPAAVHKKVVEEEKPNHNNILMKFKFLTFLAVGTALVLDGFSAPNERLVLEDFQAFSPGEVPSKGWRTRGGSAKGIYQVVDEQGERYLSAEDSGRSVQIFKKKGWVIKEKPNLQWCWRIRKFPGGSDERNGKTNDSAVGMYIVFPRRFFVPEVIKYVWSENAPEGLFIHKSKWVVVIVVRSGSKDIGTWQVERRNVYEDYQKYFGRKAPNPLVFGFLTDANAVKGTASGDYDSIEAFSEEVPSS